MKCFVYLFSSCSVRALLEQDRNCCYKDLYVTAVLALHKCMIFGGSTFEPHICHHVSDHFISACSLSCPKFFSSSYHS